MIRAALEIAIERMILTPEKLTTMLIRRMNPDEIIGQGEEASLHGVKEQTLKTYKDAGEFPRFLNGIASGARSDDLITSPQANCPAPL